MDKLAYGILGTLIAAFTVIGASKAYSTYITGMSSSYTIITEQSMSQIDDVEDYHYSVLSGAIVLSAIHMLQNEYTIATESPLGSGTYPRADFSVPNLMGSAEYIDPSDTYIGLVFKDANGVPIAVSFIEESIFTGISKSKEDLELAKVIIAQAVQNGADTNMSWEELAEIIRGIINSSSSSKEDYEELMRYLQEQINEYLRLISELENKNNSSVKEQYILDELSSVIGFSEGEITTWIRLDEEVEKLRNKIQEYQDLLTKLREEFNKYPELLERLEVIKELIRVNEQEFTDLVTRVEEANRISKELLENFYSSDKTVEVNQKNIQKLVELISNQNDGVDEANEKIRILLEQIRIVNEQIRIVVNEATTYYDQYLGQVRIYEEFLDKYNKQVNLSISEKTRYEAQLVIVAELTATYTTLTQDSDAAKSVFIKWLGSLYNSSATLTTNTDTLLSSYLAMSQSFESSTYVLVGDLSTKITQLLAPIVLNIQIKQGYVLDPTTLSGVIKGIETIPNIISSDDSLYRRMGVLRETV